MSFRAGLPSPEDAGDAGNEAGQGHQRGQGEHLLAGEAQARGVPGDDQRAGNKRFSPENRLKLAGFFAQLEPVRSRAGCSFAQLIVAWTVQHGTVTVALCGARDARQAVQNAGALQVVLDSADLAAIDAAAVQHLGRDF